MEGYNLAIIGKSGVGKSTLLNYLFNKNLAKTGSGEPVTKQGFHLFQDDINGKTVNIYDSWGIEPGKTDVWLKDLQKFLINRKSLSIKEWIHTAIFCLSAESKRIEVFEKQIFLQLKTEHLNPIIVITKADLDHDDSFFNSVKTTFPGTSIIKICSVDTKFGLGTIKKNSSRFGNEQLIDAIIKNASKSFDQRINVIVQSHIKERGKYAPARLLPVVSQMIDFRSEQFNFMGNIKEQTVQEILENVQKMVERYDRETEKDINDLLKEAKKFYSEQVLHIVKNMSQQKLDILSEKDEEPSIFSYLELPLFYVSFLTPFTLLLMPIAIVGSFFNSVSKEELMDKIKNLIETHYVKVATQKIVISSQKQL